MTDDMSTTTPTPTPSIAMLTRASVRIEEGASPNADSTDPIAPVPSLPSADGDTTNTLLMEVDTTFSGPDKHSNLKFRIRPKDDRFAVIIPAMATRGKRRTEIGFSKSLPEGLSPDFGQFIKRELQKVVSKWKRLEQAREWVTAKKLQQVAKNGEKKKITAKEKWRTDIRKIWRRRTTSHSTRAATKRRLEMRKSPSTPSTPLTYRARDSTVSITVPFLLLGSKTVAVRLYERKGAAKQKRRKDQLIVWMPAKLLDDKPNSKGKEFSMGVENGIWGVWKKYVTEYLSYAVSKWSTVSVARKWFRNYRHNFVDFVNTLFRERKYLSIPITRPWRLGPSKLPTCEKYIKSGDFPAGSKGYGVFSLHSGSHVLSYSTQDQRISALVDKRKVKLTKRQKLYRVVGGPDENWVWVPTTAALNCGVLAEAFLVNCDTEHPTHRIEHNFDGTTDIMMSEGKQVHTDEEFSLHYNYSEGDDDSEDMPSFITIDTTDMADNTGGGGVRGGGDVQLTNAAAAKKKKADKSRKKKRTVDKADNARKKRAKMRAAKKKRAADKADKERAATHADKECAVRAMRQPHPDPTDDISYLAYPIYDRGVPGECLFVAVEDQLTLLSDRATMTYQQLRKLAVTTQRDQAYVPGVSRTRAGLTAMMRATTYADNHELAALASALQLNVRLKQVREAGGEVSPWIQLTDPDSSLPTIHLMLYYKSQRSGSNHYMSMRPCTAAQTAMHVFELYDKLQPLPYFKTIQQLLQTRRLAAIPGVWLVSVLQHFADNDMDTYLVYRWVDDEEREYISQNQRPMFRDTDDAGYDVLNIALKGKKVLYTRSTFDISGERHGKETTKQPHLVVYVAGIASGARGRGRGDTHVVYGHPSKAGYVVFKETENVVAVALGITGKR